MNLKFFLIISTFFIQIYSFDKLNIRSEEDKKYNSQDLESQEKISDKISKLCKQFEDTPLLEYFKEFGTQEIINKHIDRWDIGDEIPTLIFALIKKRLNVYHLRKFIEIFPDVNVKTSFGYTPLHIAVKKNNYNAVRFFLEVGLNPNEPIKEGEEKGMTPFHLACLKNLKIAKLLEKNGGNIDLKIDGNETALIKCTKEKKLAAVKFLLKKNVNANLDDGWYDQTALHKSVKKKSAESLEITSLLISKTNLDLKDQSGCTAMEVAAKYKNLDALKIFVKANAKFEKKIILAFLKHEDLQNQFEKLLNVNDSSSNKNLSSEKKDEVDSDGELP